jgi:nucleotide-binding universal stress UspA family protein
MLSRSNNHPPLHRHAPGAPAIEATPVTLQTSSTGPVGDRPDEDRDESPPSTQPVVCGVDDSPEARAAMSLAAQLAGRLGRDLVLVHVGDSPMRERQIRDELASWAEEGGVSGTQLVAFGGPAETITDIAKELDAAMIVVGSRARGRFAAAIRGSVSADVVSRAECPVVLAPRTFTGSVV